jgi:hypothetical protein
VWEGNVVGKRVWGETGGGNRGVGERRVRLSLVVVMDGKERGRAGVGRERWWAKEGAWKGRE